MITVITSETLLILIKQDLTKWRPQVTIQHPLQCTIGLYSKLFEGTPIIQDIEQTLPVSSVLPYNTALAGLIFLLAHEMLGMANSFSISASGQELIHLAIALTMYSIEHPIETITLEYILPKLAAPDLLVFKNHKSMQQLFVILCSQDESTWGADIQKLSIGSFQTTALKITSVDFIPILQVVLEEKNKVFIQNALLMMRTLEDYNKKRQFDAKRWFSFMSRRPFAHMFTEIVDTKATVMLTDSISAGIAKKEILEKCFVMR